MKRDDCTGLATGGNKTRKLEYLVADALRQQCDTLITGGGLQSNHVRQTAAAAARVGLKCILILNESPYHNDKLYQENGNILLDQLFGAELQIISQDANMAEQMTNTYKHLKENECHPYLIPLGGSNAIGATGYVLAVEEIYQQCSANKIKPTHLICASGSGGTQAGLMLGVHLQNWPLKIYGFSVGIKNPCEKTRVDNVLASLCGLFDVNPEPLRNSSLVDENYFGSGYGQTTPESIAAIKLVAQKEGILLDPVYTGKAMAGLIDYIQQGRFNSNDTVIFIHTGGTAALSAYADKLN
jgi:D-cysteine desulfhydrase family pyridoxal phosphate-dependent enzyme